MLQKIVARYVDGRVIKGHTNNFSPTSREFMLQVHDAPATDDAVRIEIRDLKAIFFVKDFLGRRNYQKRDVFTPHQPYQGRRVKVTFKDRESALGATPEYNPKAQGFFFFPADMDGNTLKAYIVNAAVEDVETFRQPV